MQTDRFPVATTGFIATHLLIAHDINRTVDFYRYVLGGEVVFSRDGFAAIVKLANTWIIVNAGGDPTPDKPNITMEAPSDPGKAGAFLNLRVADIDARYEEWKSRGAEFLTEPLDNIGIERRCYMTDPDGRLIEVGQFSTPALAAFGLTTE